ncbi:hypothetical protein LBMAG48_14260 [Phycisphaerae bacterium]|nr:hypothetical protein LBMAG48_14260 [Phycisphaerae bacterium]
MLRERLAGIRAPIERLAREDEKVQMVLFEVELAHNGTEPRGGRGAEVGGGFRNGASGSHARVSGRAWSDSTGRECARG